MPPTQILVVDDEDDVLEMLSSALQEREFSVQTARNAKQARDALAKNRPHLILLDWMMPDMSGIEWMHSLKRDRAFADVPIIFLTCRDGEDDKLRALQAGADDYITKPFSIRELVARIRAILRRKFIPGKSLRIKAGSLLIDNEQHRVQMDGNDVLLSPTEYRLLEFLVSHPARAFHRADLLDQVWGFDSTTDERAIDVHVRRLRQKLGQHGGEDLIRTVRGFGYRFQLEPTTSQPPEPFGESLEE
jgi:two-component system, OmpR family, phosphate regulon response regulator PhoB